MSFELLDDGVRLDGETLTFAELGTCARVSLISTNHFSELLNTLQFRAWANNERWI